MTNARENKSPWVTNLELMPLAGEVVEVLLPGGDIQPAALIAKDGIYYRWLQRLENGETVDVNDQVAAWREIPAESEPPDDQPWLDALELALPGVNWQRKGGHIVGTDEAGWQLVEVVTQVGHRDVTLTPYSSYHVRPEGLAANLREAFARLAEVSAVALGNVPNVRWELADDNDARWILWFGTRQMAWVDEVASRWYPRNVGATIGGYHELAEAIDAVNLHFGLANVPESEAWSPK